MDMRSGHILWTEGMMMAALDQRSRSEQQLELTYRIIGADGHLKLVDVREYDALGRPSRVIVTVVDVTDSVQAQAQLAVSEKLFRTAFAADPIGMDHLQRRRSAHHPRR
jgi:hypothetical protein